MKKAMVMILPMMCIGLIGCGETEDLTWYRDHYNQRCREIADNYRLGLYQSANLGEMHHYFKVREGKMTAGELKALLGEPRVVMPWDDYYRHALVYLYEPEELEKEDFAGDRHDLVLHYGETGPPHGVPDESMNLFFVIKNGVVISVRELS